MSFNKNLDRLMEIKIVQVFMQHHNMRGKLCAKENLFSFIIYRLPYVVEFIDSSIENYLEIYMSDLDAGLLLSGGAAVDSAVLCGFQNRNELRTRTFKDFPKNDIFLLEGARKMFDLHCDFQAIDNLLPLIETSGGLSSMRDGTFDSRFDFKDSVQAMYPGLKEKYLQCVGNTDSK